MKAELVHRMTVLPNGTLCGAPLDGAKITHTQRKVTCPKCRRVWRTERHTIQEIGRRRASPVRGKR